jgi:hypothetical protein
MPYIRRKEMKLYGEELKKSIEREIERIREIQADREKRIADGWTDYDDCFMSIRVEEQSIDRCRMELKILSGDGCMDYEAVFDKNGKEVHTHWFRNRWGGDTIVGNGVFASSEKALLKKTGWTKKTIRVPAWTKFSSSGSGLCGVYSGSYTMVRWHTNMVTGEYVGYPE